MPTRGDDQCAFTEDKNQEQSAGIINWNHPELKSISEFCSDLYQEYTISNDLTDRCLIRASLGITTGALIGGIIGCRDNNGSLVKETILGAMVGGYWGGWIFATYPIAIPLMGIMAIKKLIRRC